MTSTGVLGRLADASRWITAEARRRWWPWVVLFGLSALVMTLTNSPGSYVFDNRFEQYWNPGQRVAKNLTTWDATRGLGRIREEFWPIATVPLWLFDLLGAPPYLIERLWHAGLLCSAGVGTMALVRRFVPESIAAQAIAGAWYAFGPFSGVFLTPSVLYMYYAAAPWFVLATVQTVTSARPWRASATLALLVFAVGNADPPALAYVAVPMVVVIGYLVMVERSVTMSRLGGALARTVPLVALTSAAMVGKTVLAAEAFAQRLYSTESPEVAGSVSSWAESLRGLGFWVSYLRIRGDLVRPDEAVLASNAWFILVSFTVPVVAMLSLWALQTRVRLLFGAMLAIGTVVMVGPFPLDDPSPWGRAWLWAAHEVPGFAALRSTYKVGATYSFGVSTLFALGVVAAATGRGGRRTPARSRAVGVAAAVAIVIGAFPFWSGNLYDPELQVTDGIPGYWMDAMDWLDDQPGDTRVLTLPGLTRARYRWGSPGDDIIDTWLARPHVENIAVPLTTPVPADLLEAIDVGAFDGNYEQGLLAPILRRIGVEYVLIRNDLMWEELDVRRPADLSTLRADPDLDLVRTFGEPGENTVGVVSGQTSLERRLPPIEIYRLADPPSSLPRVTSAEWVLLEGGGAGWWRLSRLGLLDGEAPVVYAAPLETDIFRSRLERGERLVVSDTNRRTSQSVFAFTAARSWTLGPGEEFGRGVPDIFKRAGSQSVAVFEDGAQIRDLDAERALISGFRPHFRASQAFDGDLTTGWVAEPILDLPGRTIRVDLPAGLNLDGVEVTAFDPKRPERAVEGESFTSVPRIGRLAVRFSNGDEHAINMITGRGRIDFDPTEVTWIELRIEDVTAEREVGIAEVQLSGTRSDLAEWIRTPDTVFREARDDAGLRAALRAASIWYSFERDRGAADVPVENQMRREFETVGDRTFEISGRLSDVAASPSSECRDVGLRLDGRAVEVAVSGPDGAFTGCEPVDLENGRHRLWGTAAAIDDVLLTTDDREPPEPRRATVERTASSDSHRAYEVSNTEPAVLIGGDGFDPRWSARSEGRPLAAPLMVDAQAAWIVPPGSRASVVADFAPHRIFRAALGVSGVGVLLCIAVIIGSRRRGRT